MRALLFATAMIASTALAADTLKAGTFDPPRAAPEFSLKGSDGTELQLSRYRGKVVVLGFGFTHCPEVCPTTLAMRSEERRVGKECRSRWAPDHQKKKEGSDGWGQGAHKVGRARRTEGTLIRGVG